MRQHFIKKKYFILLSPSVFACGEYLCKDNIAQISPIKCTFYVSTIEMWHELCIIYKFDWYKTLIEFFQHEKKTKPEATNINPITLFALKDMNGEPREIKKLSS